MHAKTNNMTQPTSGLHPSSLSLLRKPAVPAAIPTPSRDHKTDTDETLSVVQRTQQEFEILLQDLRGGINEIQKSICDITDTVKVLTDTPPLLTLTADTCHETSLYDDQKMETGLVLDQHERVRLSYPMVADTDHEIVWIQMQRIFSNASVEFFWVRLSQGGKMNFKIMN